MKTLILPLILILGVSLSASAEDPKELSCWIVSVTPAGVLFNPDKMIVRGPNSLPARNRDAIAFLADVPTGDLVDDQHFYAIAEPAGTYQYTGTDGGIHTVRKFSFLRWGKPSDRAPNF